jgi:cysteine desulfurase
MEHPVYLDNHATTRMDPRVIEAMAPWLDAGFGNPASRSHRHGWVAEEAVEKARAQVADLVGAKSQEIVFTAGTTESNNTILKGLGLDVVTTAIEHKSILATCAWMKTTGRRIDIVGVDGTGTLDPEKVAGMVAPPHIVLVSMMLANNEVGSIQPVGETARLVLHKALVHSDLAQAVGKIPVRVDALGIQFASFSAHKMYGPKGIGAMYIKDEAAHLLSPLVHGGGQERGFRSGTLNVPAIVGFGKACQIAKEAEYSPESSRIEGLRDRLEQALAAAIPGMVVHGGERRLPGNLHFSVPCCDPGAFMAFLSEEVSVSSGSACMSNAGRSHVLAAMGIGDDEDMRSVRACVGRFNTHEDIDHAAEAIVRALDKSNRGG